MLKLNKEKFLETELGSELDNFIRAWDEALDKLEYPYGTIPYENASGTVYRCRAQWKVYQMAIKQFYGIEYYFTRTDEYYGLVTEDETDWLLKVER